MIQLSLPQLSESLSEIEAQQIKALPKLLEEHRASLESELGALFVVVDKVADGEPTWFVGPFSCNSEIRTLGLEEPLGPEVFWIEQKKY